MGPQDIGEERRAEVAFEIAKEKIVIKNYSQAISLLVDVLSLAHEPWLTAKALQLIGICFFRQERFCEAKGFLEIAIEKFKELEEGGEVLTAQIDLKIIENRRAQP